MEVVTLLGILTVEILVIVVVVSRITPNHVLLSNRKGDYVILEV